MMGRDLGLGWGLVDDDDKGSSSSGSSKKARGGNEWVSQMGWREGIRVHRQAEWKRATLTPFFFVSVQVLFRQHKCIHVQHHVLLSLVLACHDRHTA